MENRYNHCINCKNCNLNSCENKTFLCSKKDKRIVAMDKCAFFEKNTYLTEENLNNILQKNQYGEVNIDFILKMSFPPLYIASIISNVLKDDSFLPYIGKLRDYASEKIPDYVLIYDYYGPILAKEIINNSQSRSICEYIRTYYLYTIKSKIENSDYEGALKLYISVFKYLSEKANIKIEKINCDNYNALELANGINSKSRHLTKNK